MTFLLAVFLPAVCFAAAAQGADAKPDPVYDLVVYGDSSGAVVAAISAKREGRSVIFVNPTGFPGGMTASGLGATDFLGKRGTFGGIASEFYDGVAKKEKKQKLKSKTTGANDSSEGNN